MKKEKEEKQTAEDKAEAKQSRRAEVKTYFEQKKRDIEAQYAQLNQQYAECKAVLEAMEEE